MKMSVRGLSSFVRSLLGCLLMIMTTSQVQAVQAAELVVVANKATGLSYMSPQEVRTLYTSANQKLPSGMVAQPIDQASGSAAREAFLIRVAGMSQADYDSHWASTSGSKPSVQKSIDLALRLVLAKPMAITYVMLDDIPEGAMRSLVIICRIP